MEFLTPDILAKLEMLTAADLDELPFGVVAMKASGEVVAYNTAESLLSGLTPARVIGRNFFISVAPCTNNYMVAELFQSEPILDRVIDYVFTLRMAPTPVHLRLLKNPEAARMYLLVQRRGDHAT